MDDPRWMLCIALAELPPEECVSGDHTHATSEYREFDCHMCERSGAWCLSPFSIFYGNFDDSWERRWREFRAIGDTTSAYIQTFICAKSRHSTA